MSKIIKPIKIFAIFLFATLLIVIILITFLTFKSLPDYNRIVVNSLVKQDKGLIAVAFHNRSVDMLLKWINSQVKTVSLYKKIKIKLLSNFVKKDREAGGSKTFETLAEQVV